MQRNLTTAWAESAAEAAALFAGLELSAYARAYPARIRTTSGSAIPGIEALPADELNPAAVTDVLRACRIELGTSGRDL